MSANRISISACTTWHVPFADDLKLYRKAGADGIGLWERKLPAEQDEQSLQLLRDSGLSVSVCFSTVASVLPTVLWPGPTEYDQRVLEMCRRVERLARFHPDSVAILTGRRGDRSAGEARQLVIEGMREVAATARRLNVRLVLEPLRAGPGILISTIHEAVQLIEEVGVNNVGVLADAWHLWDQPQLRDDVRNHRDRIWAVQLDDARARNRGWSDRLLPGDGSIDLIGFVRLMDEFGYSGWYDVEILSGDGTLENEYPDSLWKLDPGHLTAEAVRRVHALLEGARSHDKR